MINEPQCPKLKQFLSYSIEGPIPGSWVRGLMRRGGGRLRLAQWIECIGIRLYRLEEKGRLGDWATCGE